MNTVKVIDEEVSAEAIESLTEDVEYTLETLGEALMHGKDGLFKRLEGVNGPLEEEARQLANKAAALRQSHRDLQPRVEAQVRLLGAEIDRAIAEGRDSDAEAKQRESAELSQNLEKILGDAEACDQRAQELDAEQQRNYRRVFSETYPALREATSAAVVALIGLLDVAWNGLLQYQQQSGLTNLVRVDHKLDLTPRESGHEAGFYLKMRAWFR